jgi:hypothetical protein
MTSLPSPKTCNTCIHSINEDDFLCTQVIHLVTGRPVECMTARGFDHYSTQDGKLDLEYASVHEGSPASAICGCYGGWWAARGDSK